MSNENICTTSEDGQHIIVLDVDRLENLVHRHIHPNPHRIPLKCFGCGQTVELTTHAFDNNAIEWSGVGQPLLEARTGDTEYEIISQIAIILGYPADWDGGKGRSMLGAIGMLVGKVRPNPVSGKTGVGKKYLTALREAGVFIDPEWIPREYDEHGHHREV